MALSLHQAIIPNWLQVLGAVDGLLDKAEGYVADGKAGEKELLETRLAEDMLPLAYQFKSCWTHSHLALEGARKGHFSPDMNPYPEDFASLREMLATARKTCEQTSEDELEDIAGNDMVFAIGDRFSCSASPTRTSISTRPLRTTSCAWRGSRSASATISARCG